MIELVVTCFLFAGQTYAFPPGWIPVEVYAGAGITMGQYSERTAVKMSKSINIGEVVALPVGCEVQAQKKEQAP